MTGKEAVATERPYQKVVELLRNRVTLDSGGNLAFEIAANVIDTIAQAETADDIFAANDSGPLGIEDYLNTPVNVFALRFMKSAEQYTQNGQGLGVYVVIDCYDDKGEQLLLSTGAPNVVASLFRLEQIGAFTADKPLRLKIASRVTPNGQLYTVAKP